MEVKKSRTISQITVFIIVICSFLCPLARAEDVSDYISYIYIYQVWDYGDPTDSKDLMYEFDLEVNAFDSRATLMSTDVSFIEFSTPVGYTFQIPKLPDQQSGDTWTSYEYNPDNGGEARWKYKARFSSMADLLDYNNGVYTITLHLNGGGQVQTTALVIVSQPVQEPVLISPAYNQTLESPVTFSWEPCTDLQAKTIWIDMQEQTSETTTGTTVGVDATDWGPVNLIQGQWEMDILFAQYDGFLNGDGIWIDVDRYSKSTYTFTISSESTDSNNLNISKSVVNEDPIAAGDMVTYKISIDTFDLTEEAKDVYLIDYLPDEVNFVSGSAPFGFYDEDEHRYLWIISSLAPGTTRDLLITVQVKPNVPYGSEITNSATVDSDGKPAKTVSVTFTINKEASSIAIQNIQIISGSIIRDDIADEVIISFGMPNGIGQEDIDTDKPIMLDLDGVQIAADNIKIEEIDGKVQITVFFDKFAILDALSGYGQFDVEIIGQLIDGRTFSGRTTIVITDTKLVSNYISKIYFDQFWNYENPTDSNDETYEFFIKISAESDKAYNMNADVNSIEVSTPTDYTFNIQKLPGQWSDNIWTSYEYEVPEGIPDISYQYAVWEYRILFSDIADLQDYGDGEYTIILHYNDGSMGKTTAWFGMADAQNPVPQPPEPNIAYPSPNEIVESPITCSWESFGYANYSNIWISLEEKTNGGFKEEYFNVNETSWDPIYLTSGKWEITMIFDNSSIISDSDDGIVIESYKYSQSRYDFKVINYLTNTYEVWGGDTLIDAQDRSYGSIADMNEYGYEKLIVDPNKPGTFSGEYNYYVIATKGEFLLDSIRGSNGSYIKEFGATDSNENIINRNYLLNEPDGLCATIGDNNPSDDYCGWLAFENPDGWEGLTVITRKLNISKKATNTLEELENISPGDTINYMISFDSSEMFYDVNNVKIIDYLPDDMNFISADTNEVSGIYDANEHTVTWFKPLLPADSVVELTLTVEVNMDVDPGAIITNFVTIDSNETPATVASEPVTVSKNQQQVVNMQLNPDTISRHGTDVSGVMVIMEMPPYITEKKILIDEPLVLSLDSEDSGISVNANEDKIVREYEGVLYVVAVFDKTRLLNAIPGYGQKKIKVEGKLIAGSFIGRGILTIN